MTTIKTSQLVRYNDRKIPVPVVGDTFHNKNGEITGTVAAVRLIGKPKRKLHLGQFLGHVQELELDVVS